MENEGVKSLKHSIATKMADDTDQPVSKNLRKLPPLSPRGQSALEDSTNKVVKKKKKNTHVPEDDVNGEAQNIQERAPAKPKIRDRSLTPQQRDKTNRSRPNDGTEGETESDPKPKKRRSKSKDEEATENKSLSQENEDVTGSKASLIGRDSDGTGSPKKKGKKKKAKSNTGISNDQFGDAVLAQDLTFISEDVVAERVKDEDTDDKPKLTSPNILRSQPTEKLYIETNRGFKGEDKSKLARKKAEEENEKTLDFVEPSRMTTMEFGLQTHKVFKTFGLFLHGLLAGIALWHIVIVYILSEFPTEDFLQHYRPLAMPVQSMYYILLALCTVSACDRCDVANTRGRFFRKAFSLQNTAIAIIIYFLAIILSLSIISTEDKINLWNTKPELWKDLTESETELSLWRTLNTVRGVSIILGWIVLSVAPNADRLGDNLKEGDDEILGKDVEMSGVATA